MPTRRTASRPQAAAREQDPAELRLGALSHAHVDDLLPPDPNSEHRQLLARDLPRLGQPRDCWPAAAQDVCCWWFRKDRSLRRRKSVWQAYLGCTPTIITRRSDEIVFCCEGSISTRIEWRSCSSANVATAREWPCVSTRASTLPGWGNTPAINRRRLFQAMLSIYGVSSCSVLTIRFHRSTKFK